MKLWTRTAALLLSWLSWFAIAASAAGAKKKDAYQDAAASSAVHVLDSVAAFDAQVKASDQVWMIQFYNAQQQDLTKIAPLFLQVGAIVKGLFSLGVVNVATDDDGLQALARQYGVNVQSPTPTVIILAEDKATVEESFSDAATLQDPNAYLRTLMEVASDVIGQRMGQPPQRQKKRRQDQESSSSSSRPTSSGSSSSNKRRTTAFAKLQGTDDFEARVLQNPQVVLVAFTAPWCGHCQRLEPEMKQAGKALAAEEVLLAWVNAEDDRPLAGLYGVKGFPTIKLFPGGTPKTHQQAQDFVYERNAQTISQVLLQEVARSGVPKALAEVTSAQVLQDECAGANHLCVLAAVPDILDTGAEGRNKYVEILQNVSKTFTGSGSFAFAWYDGPSQPGLLDAFDLTFGFPALVAFSMDRLAFAVLHASFTEAKIAAFLHSITTGRQATIKLDAVPAVATVEPWDGQDGVPIEEEFDLSELFDDEGDEEDDKGGEL